MPRPRVLDYDDLHGYLEEHRADAYAMARDAADEHDDGARRFHAGRASAFADLIEHVQAELESAR